MHSVLLREGWFVSLKETGLEKNVGGHGSGCKIRRYRTSVLFSERKRSFKFSSFFRICLYFGVLPYVGMTAKFTLNIFQGTPMLK